MEYIILSISGGIGKNIISTGLIKAIKKKYPQKEIIVVTAYEEVFWNNPNIHKVFKFDGLIYFYDDYIKNKDTIIFMHDPYHETNHIYGREHLIETWCKLFDIPYDGEEPELYLLSREIDYVKNNVLGGITKPIFIIQPNGGANGVTDLPYSWARDLPYGIAQDIVDHYSNSYHVLQIKKDNQPLLNNTNALTLPLRQLFSVLLFSEKRLFIDSFAQHASAALNLPSTVCWIINKPEVFGYDIHTNIVSTVEEKYKTTKYSYLQPYNITGAINEYPYDTRDLFNKNEILDALASNK
jgi:hypothetical protein